MVTMNGGNCTAFRLHLSYSEQHVSNWQRVVVVTHSTLSPTLIHHLRYLNHIALRVCSSAHSRCTQKPCTPFQSGFDCTQRCKPLSWCFAVCRRGVAPGQCGSNIVTPPIIRHLSGGNGKPAILVLVLVYTRGFKDTTLPVEKGRALCASTPAKF